jgi:hypothetical protein
MKAKARHLLFLYARGQTENALEQHRTPTMARWMLWSKKAKKMVESQSKSDTRTARRFFFFSCCGREQQEGTSYGTRSSAVGHCAWAHTGAGPTWRQQRATAEDLVPQLDVDRECVRRRSKVWGKGRNERVFDMLSNHNGRTRIKERAAPTPEEAIQEIAELSRIDWRCKVDAKKLFS